MSNYMDLAMKEAKQEWLEEQRMVKHYKQIHLSNLIKRAEFMSEAPQNPRAERHRLSKEIALEMLEQHGAFAYMMALEKHENSAFWRDVLTWLDELTQGEKK